MRNHTISTAMQQAIAAGLNNPTQIIQSIRRNGAWFITWVAK